MPKKSHKLPVKMLVAQSTKIKHFKSEFWVRPRIKSRWSSLDVRNWEKKVTYETWLFPVYVKIQIHSRKHAACDAVCPLEFTVCLRARKNWMYDSHLTPAQEIKKKPCLGPNPAGERNPHTSTLKIQREVNKSQGVCAAAHMTSQGTHVNTVACSRAMISTHCTSPTPHLPD